MTSDRIQLYGAHWCPDCRRSKRFLGEQQISYDWIDIEQDEEARHRVEELNNGKRIIPTIVFPDGAILVEPSNAELAQHLGLRTTAEHPFYDLLVVGAGPAGLTAALYAAREGASSLVVEMGGLGGQAAATQDLDNLPGFPDGISGTDFAERLVRQAQRYGVEILQAQEVVSIARRPGNSRWITTGDGSEYGACAMVVASGAEYRRLGVPGEDDYTGAGVHFCATCDGPFYKGEELVVVGGGNSAVEEGLFLTRFSPKVTLLVRGDHLTASQVAVDKILASPAVEVLFRHEVREISGAGGKLKSVAVEDKATGATEVLTPGGVFVFIGQQPSSGFLADTLALDKWGYVLTGHELARSGAVGEEMPALLETSMPGVFAAGDVRAGSTKQVASAAGEGATAALLVREYLRAH